MKNTIKAVGGVLVLGVVVALVAQFLGGKNPAVQKTPDLPALRMELREQVAKGRLTEAEAQVRLAEAIAAARQKDKAKVKAMFPPELEALWTQLKDQVAQGMLSEEEAKAAFIEAKTQWDTEAGEKKQPASGMTK